MASWAVLTCLACTSLCFLLASTVTDHLQMSPIRCENWLEFNSCTLTFALRPSNKQLLAIEQFTTRAGYEGNIP